MNYLQKKKLAFMSVVNSVKGFVRNITGVFPLTLTNCVDSRSIIDYTMYGNSVQNGTPTPDNPIEVESVGEFDESTGKYKIPIKVSSNGKTVTTNIYLDEPLRKVSNSDCLYYENQICARGVKEYICKGNEGWYKSGEKDGLVRYYLGGKIPAGTARRRSILTNMYPQINNHLSDWWQLNTVQAWGFQTQPGWIGVCVSIEDFPTVTDFKNFVATKYSEGNPLKMYFEISATETPITLPPIPTFKGTSIISADTSVQPSNAEIEYYSNVKE